MHQSRLDTAVAEMHSELPISVVYQCKLASGPDGYISGDQCHPMGL